ncbi:ISL3 family transposase [Streptococcus saliviloxodontae]|uniref:Transposase n=6 Tax=Streptococcus saliviloxodontae TaxID=1349416 RepID=A0ABS2PJD7_9STRE|nr:ISL3 family transposase [Streptococcus saliviloxodontae]MBM7635387.1 transposase [Streptococcus saliviloxodontae]
MELQNYIKESLNIKDPNIIFDDKMETHSTHREYHAKLDYNPPKCPACQGQMAKYDFQKPCKIPYLETVGFKVLIRLKKRRFKCKACGKMTIAKTSLVRENHQIPNIINHKITEKLMSREAMTKIANDLSVSVSTVYRQLDRHEYQTDLNHLPQVMSWDEYAFKKGKMSFIAQDFESNKIIAILDGRTQAVIKKYFMRYSYKIRKRVKVITMDMFSPYYDIAKSLFPNAEIVLDRFHIIQNLSRAMNRFRIQIMNQFDRKSHEYRALKRYWKLIQQDSRKLSDKRFYRPTFRAHLTNHEIVKRLLSYSDELKQHYELYQCLLFHFQEKQTEHFFGLIADTIKEVNPSFKTVFSTFLKDQDKIINAMMLPYSNAKLEATNNLIKVIKRNAFGFRNFTNFKKRILIALNMQKERTNLILSRC